MNWMDLVFGVGCFLALVFLDIRLISLTKDFVRAMTRGQWTTSDKVMTGVVVWLLGFSILANAFIVYHGIQFLYRVFGGS